MNAVFTKQEQLFYMTELNECPYKPEQYERNPPREKILWYKAPETIQPE